MTAERYHRPMPMTEQASLDQRWDEFRKLDRLKNQWYWRPGWHTGRRFYTWHLTFDGYRDLHDLSARIQRAIDLPYLSLVPDRWLHLTMQGLGFTGEVHDSDLAAIVDAARKRCREVAPFDMSLGPGDADSEGVGLLIQSWQPVADVRTAIRNAIATVWAEVPEPSDGFRPHVTVAYSAADEPCSTLRERLSTLRSMPPVTIRIATVELIRLGRDQYLYEWDVVAAVPLGHRLAAGLDWVLPGSRSGGRMVG